MRRSIYILLFISLTPACDSNKPSTNTESTFETSKSVELTNSEKSRKDSVKIENEVDCNFIYDTIKSKKYGMHLRILEKFHNKEKRGYYFSSEGDTLNNFLYHQDVAAFTLGLDSTEEGNHKLLTNKVVFLILENDPKVLDYGLTQRTRGEKQLNYFMSHVSNPSCNTIPVDSIIKIIQRDMGEPHTGARKVKQMLLNHLEMSIK